jgi:hypothetical protein
MFTRILFCGLFCAISWAAPAAERISTPLRNPAAAGTSRAPSVSGDGRFIAFESTSRLTRDDASPHTDVFVYDRTTKTTRLVSDDRGGDQPVISANGRFVAYRSLESALTRIRVRDLERGGVPLTASFQVDVALYDRAAQLAAITPDGRYVAYVVRPQPNVDSEYGFGYGHQIVVADTLLPRTPLGSKRVQYRDSSNFYDGYYLNHLGRMAISADAKFVVFDTTDKLTADDNNGVSDVYRAAVDTISLQRLSKASGVADLGGATQPVMALDGNTALFLCENPLVPEDTDERMSVYMSGSGNNFAVPKYIPTQSTPAALAAQATVSGKFFAFLNNKGRAFVRDLTGEDDLPIAPKANARLFSPILSGDDRLAVFATKASNLSPGDGPSSIDVFATANPNNPPERAAPVVSLTLSNGTALVEENTTTTIGASATPGSGMHELMIVEVDGIEKFRTNSPTLAPQNFTVTRGVHDVRARAFNDAWIEGSELKSLIVVPAGALGITGTVSLERSDAPDGSATFNAILRIDNRRATATQPLQVMVKLTSLPQIMSAAGAGNFGLVPDRGESILTLIDVPALSALETTTVIFAGTTPATEVIGDGFQGNGWVVLAQLREQSGPNFVDIESPATVLTTTPRLNENTDLPNTGIPVVGPPNENGFDAGLLQSVTISGPVAVAEGSGASFSALAVFSNGSQACSPEWSLTGANASRATIDARGRLTTKSVDSPTKVTIRAAFSSVAATKEVTIKPTSPIISITASVPTASESGDAGEFRLLRTRGNKEELSVNYTVTGKATNGADYATLSGTATFPEGTSTALLDIVPQQDADFEGAENVIATLEPGPGYRLKKKISATVEISDDEPFPVNQPDLTMRHGKGPTIGAFVIDADPDEVGQSQVLTVGGKRGRRVTFTISLINRGDVPRDYTLRGGSAATGFTIQYLDGQTDVTADVIAGTFVVSQLAPASARELSVVVTPTSETPIGGSLYTVIQAQADTRIDAVATFVERVK